MEDKATSGFQSCWLCSDSTMRGVSGSQYQLLEALGVESTPILLADFCRHLAGHYEKRRWTRWTTGLSPQVLLVFLRWGEAIPLC